MERKELIEIAQHCGTGDCHPACPYKEGDWDLESVMYCMEDLIKALADKLEKAMSEIPKDCRTCRHIKKNIRELPCSACAVSSDNKDWAWRGDAE